MKTPKAPALLIGLCFLAASCGKDASAKSPPSPQAGKQMMAALASRDVNAMRAALDAGEEANAHDQGKPIVALAAASGLADIVALLLDRGAQIEAATDLGVTPLFAAAASAKSDCARLLISRGANVNAANSTGATVLIMATNSGDEDLAIYLLEKGADGKAASKRNKSTALMIAARNDMLRLMRALVAAGVDVDAVDALGNTARTYAKSTAARAILTEAGADATADIVDPDAQQNVRKAFANYQRVVRESGDDAGKMMSRSTTEMFARLCELALRTPPETLRKQPIHEQFGALRLRASFDADRLEKMSGEQLITFAIQNGWVDKEGTAAMQLGKILVAGRAASADIEQDGQPIGMRLVFAKEDDGWKLDLSQLMAAGEIAIRSLLDHFDGSQEQQLVSLISEVTGKQIGDDIWQPLRR